MSAQDTRPFYLNLIKIRLPLPGIVSIFHRISGILLFLAIPFFSYLLDMSLRGSAGFQHASELLQQPLLQFILILLVASLVHHFYAGIRFLLTDFDIGLEKSASIKTAWMVIVAEILTLLFILLGVCL